MSPNQTDVVDEIAETGLALRQDLALGRAPEVILNEAHRAAKALTDVLDGKKKKVMFNNEQYLEAEDWQTLGRFYGITAKEDGDPEYVDMGMHADKGHVHGFKASAVALRADGVVISRATAYCLTDEDKWNTRAKYEWQETTAGRAKVQVGDEPVPMFQLASMAQTRACAKVMRNILAWVVVLAGYRPTPSEELDQAEVVTKPAGRSRTKAAEETQPSKKDVKPIPTTGIVTVDDVQLEKGIGKNKKPYTRYIVHLSDGQKPATFDEDLATQAESYKVQRTRCVAQIRHDGPYLNLTGLTPVETHQTTSQGPSSASRTPARETRPLTPVSQVEPPADRFTPTRIVEWRNAQGIANRWGIQTQELGDGEYIETNDKTLARAAFQAKLDGNQVELLFQTVKEGDGPPKRLLRELTIVRAATSTPDTMEAEFGTANGDVRG